MTVAVSTRRTEYEASGLTTGPFASEFPFFEIDVYLDGALVDPADYTISQTSPGSEGDITFDTAPVGTILIVAKTNLGQQTDFISSNDVDPEVTEKSFDRVSMALQELSERISGSLATDWVAKPGRLVKSDAQGLFAPFEPGTGNGGVVFVTDAGVVSSDPNATVVAAPDLTGLTEDTANDGDADFLWAYKTSGPGQRKVKPSKLGWKQSGTGATRRDLQTKLREVFSVKDFGATGDGVTDDSAAIQAAVTAAAVAGGVVLVPRGGYLCNTSITVGSDVIIAGEGPNASSIFSTATDGTILNFSGASRAGMRDILVYRNKRASASTSICVKLTNCVQFLMSNCRLQGAYHCLVLTGTACSDVTVFNCSFSFSTGSAMVRAFNTAGSGVCGAFHFIRCLFNQEYALQDAPSNLGVPTSTKYKGNWASTTAYTAGDIVASGGMYWRCKTGGTSGATAVGTVGASKWYFEDVADGSVTWRLVGATDYRGLLLDTGTTYGRVRECDFTGPFLAGIDIANTAAGAVPVGMVVENCTSHGQILYGLSVSAGYQIHIHDFDTFGGTQNNCAGIAISNSDMVTIKDCKIITNNYGIILNSGAVTISGNMIGNCGVAGIYVSPAVSKFLITNNLLGSTPAIGGNGNAVIVASGASDRYVITHNIVNGSGAITDGGTGTNKSVTANF